VGCGARFPIREGIPLLAIPGASETWEQTLDERTLAEVGTLPEARPDQPSAVLSDMGAETSEDYQTWYQDLEEARRYNEAYQRERMKRWSTGREAELLHRLLSSQPRSATLLDLPCGGGRLSPILSEYSDQMIEADIGFGQLLYGREHYRGAPESRLWMTASAFHIPLRAGSVDGVVCCRLSHHLPTVAERERLVSELLRVARRFVILTFFDHHSVKNTLRRIRRPFDGKPPKMTLSVEQVRELARQGGAELVAQPALSRLFSGHRYALMVKR
jgi:SAM-dependent methyltransferase